MVGVFSYPLQFSTKSDVWSYGITLHEIFTNADIPYGKVGAGGTQLTVGRSGRPVGDGAAHLGSKAQNWSNLNVMVEVERGFRLKAPKGCPRAIYKLMMSTWNPFRR
jgi:c-src tyrosine kinase